MVKLSAYVTLLYGLLVLSMGFLGYQNASSTMSLIMGSGVGGFVIVCSIFMIKEKRIANYLAIFFTAILMTAFIFRYVLTGSFMTISMATISGLVIVLQIARLFLWVQRED